MSRFFLPIGASCARSADVVLFVRAALFFILLLSCPIGAQASEEPPGHVVLHSIADLDGDGVADTVRSSPAGDAMASSGRVRIVCGVDGSELCTLRGRAPHDWFGFDVVAVPDVNNDGLADLLVGAPRDERGRAFLFHSPFGVMPFAHRSADEADQRWSPVVDEAFDFGDAVAPFMDCNGDRVTDLRVRSWRSDAHGREWPVTEIRSGRTGWPLVIVEGDEPWDLWTPLIGDLDDDGRVSDADVQRVIEGLGEAVVVGALNEDVNRDGLIDATDLEIVRHHLGTTVWGVKRHAARNGGPPDCSTPECPCCVPRWIAALQQWVCMCPVNCGPCEDSRPPGGDGLGDGSGEDDDGGGSDVRPGPPPDDWGIRPPVAPSPCLHQIVREDEVSGTCSDSRACFVLASDECAAIWSLSADPPGIACFIDDEHADACSTPPLAAGPAYRVCVWFMAPGTVTLTAVLEGDGCDCNAELAVLTVPVHGIDLDIDSDNDNRLDPPDRTEAEDRMEDVEHDPDQPGRILIVHQGDVDRDGVPNYADGYDLIEGDGFTDDDDSPGDRFVPMVLELHPPEGDDESCIVFDYDESPPLGVTLMGATYTPASGSLRIWRRDADAPRSGLDLLDDGDFIAAGTEYPVSALWPDGQDGPLTLFLEAVAPSATLGDQAVTVSYAGCSDRIRVSITGIEYVTALADDTIVPIERPRLTHSTPVITAATLDIVDLKLSADERTLRGDIVLAGTIDDDLSDMTEGPAGTIDRLHVLVNDEILLDAPGGDPVTVPVAVTKSFDDRSVRRRHDYSGSFNARIENVDLYPVWTTIRLVAANARGAQGFSERSFNIRAMPPAPRQIDVSLEYYDGHLESRTMMFQLYEDGELVYCAVLFRDDDGVYVDPILGDIVEPHIPDGVQDPRSLVAEVTLEHLALEQIVIVVDDPDRDWIFGGHRVVRPHHDETWRDHRLEIERDPAMRSSLGTDLEPVALRRMGPASLPPGITLEIWEHGVDGSALAFTTDLGGPVEGVITPWITPGISTLDEQIARYSIERRMGTWDFIEGLGAGLFATGVDLIDGVQAVVGATWYVAKNYTVTLVYRFFAGDDLILEEDMRRIEAAAAFIEVMASIVVPLLEDGASAAYAIWTGDLDTLITLGAEYEPIMDALVHVVDVIGDHLAGLDSYERGTVMGRLTGEALIAMTTVGIGTLTTSALLHRVAIGAQTAGDVIPPAVVSAMGEVIDRAEDMASARHCFAPGTPVLTAEGPRPIECIRVGDRVLARDPHSNRQGFRPVVTTVRTVPVELFRVRYRPREPRRQPGARPDADDDDEGESHLQCTGEHPFFVKERGAFVAARDLRPGSTLVLATGGEAVVTANDRTPVPDGPWFETYNLQVAEWPTYFAGQPAVWVHNTGPKSCEYLFGIIRKIREEEQLDHWSTFVRSLEITDTPRGRRRAGPMMGDAVESLMLAMYREAIDADGVVDLTKVKSVAEIRALQRGVHRQRLKGHDLENHHTVPMQWARHLLSMRAPFASYSEHQWSQLLDEMPGFLLNVHYHRSMGADVSSFHTKLDSLMTGINPADPNLVLARLEQAYAEWDSDLGPTIWTVAREWLRQQGVSP